MAGQFWEKDYAVRHFFTSVLTTAMKMPKTKWKIPEKMCQLIYVKVYPQ